MAAAVAVWVTADCKLVLLHSGLFMRPHFGLDEMMRGLIWTESVSLKNSTQGFGTLVHLKKVICTQTQSLENHIENSTMHKKTPSS